MENTVRPGTERTGPGKERTGGLPGLGTERTGLEGLGMEGSGLFGMVSTPGTGKERFGMEVGEGFLAKLFRFRLEIHPQAIFTA